MCHNPTAEKINAQDKFIETNESAGLIKGFKHYTVRILFTMLTI